MSVAAGVSDGEAGGDAGTDPPADDEGTSEAVDAPADVGAVVAGSVVVVAGVVTGAGVVGVGVGVGVVGVGVGVVGVGVGVGAGFSNWQLVTTGLGVTVPVTVPPGPLPVAAWLNGAMTPLTARPAVVASMMPPATRPIETGRTRTKHMEGPARDARCSTI